MRMTAVKEIKATLRPKAGKGAARAVRREGRTPAVIYGANQPPLAIAVDHIDIRTKIYAGHFLTTLYDIDIDGKKHRVIPRDYQLDPVKDVPVHVDFMRLSEGVLVRVNVPVHVINTEASPGVKRGGAVNIVSPIAASYPLFTLLLNAIILREERLTGRLIAGVTLMVGGVAALLAF